MKRYLGILIVTLLLSSQGCRKAITGEEMLMGEGMTMDMTFKGDTSDANENLSNAIKNMRIFLFSPTDGLLKSEVSNIKKGIGNEVSFKLPVGKWDIVAVSNLESDALNLTVKHGATRDQILHQFEYKATGLGVIDPSDKGANSYEIVMFTILDTSVSAGESSSLGEVVFRRMVGKVTAAIVNYTGYIKVDGQHEIEIFGVPTKLSFQGGLLNSSLNHSRTAPEILGSGQKMIRKMKIGVNLPIDAKDNKSTFIIPAWHDYEGGNINGNNKLGIRIRLEKISGGFYEKTLDASKTSKTLAANKELYIKITANADIETDSEIKDWGDISVDGDILGVDLQAQHEILMDWNTPEVTTSYSSNIAVEVIMPTKPSWLTSAVVTSSKDKKTGVIVFNYNKNSTNYESYIITLKSGNVSKEMIVRNSGISPLVYTDFNDKVVIDASKTNIATVTKVQKARQTDGTNSIKGSNTLNNIGSLVSDEKNHYLFEVAKTDEIKKNWLDAINMCYSKIDDGGGWRLPTKGELKMIHKLKVNLESQAEFDPFSSNIYWSSTEELSSSSWYVNLGSGDLNSHSKSNPIFVRCVRDLPIEFNVFPSVYTDNYGKVLMDALKLNPYTVTKSRKARQTDGTNNTKGSNSSNNIGSQVSNNQNHYLFEVAKTDEIKKSWLNAINTCYSKVDNINIGGWRLPTKGELQVMADISDYFEAETGFNKFIAGIYWSSTELDANNSYNINFSDNTVSNGDKTIESRVRCVRDFPIIYPTLSDVYTDSKGRVVMDAFRLDPSTVTRVKKARQTDGTNYTKGSNTLNDIGSEINDRTIYHLIEVSKTNEIKNWLDAINECYSKTDDGGGWRMPTRNELLMISKLKSSFEAEDGFTPFVSNVYWAASENYALNYVWYVNFNNGLVTSDNKTIEYNIRCVRDL